jgi:hypothetical protein
MKRFLAILLLALLVTPTFAQSPQEMQREAYLPTNPIFQHVTKALTGAILIQYTGTGTNAQVTLASPTLTVGSTAGTYTFDIASTAYDTLQELVAAVNTKAGWNADLGGQFKGTEASLLVDAAAQEAKTGVATLEASAGLNYGTKLYLADKTPTVFRVLWTNTYSGGTSYLKVYRGSSPDTSIGDTLVAQFTSAATTVEKDVDLTPYFMQGYRSGYLKLLVENSTNQSVGTMTIMGSYK